MGRSKISNSSDSIYYSKKISMSERQHSFNLVQESGMIPENVMDKKGPHLRACLCRLTSCYQGLGRFVKPVCEEKYAARSSMSSSERPAAIPFIMAFWRSPVL